MITNVNNVVAVATVEVLLQTRKGQWAARRVAKTRPSIKSRSKFTIQRADGKDPVKECQKEGKKKEEINIRINVNGLNLGES